LGERYKEVTDEVIQYARGDWGKEESDSVDPNIKDRILSRARTKELMRDAHELSIGDLRRKLGGPSVPDDELLLRYFVGIEDVNIMRRAGRPKEYFSTLHPLATLIGELANRERFCQVHIQQPRLNIRLGKTSKKHEFYNAT
jgi:hypothetical protein